MKFPFTLFLLSTLALSTGNEAERPNVLPIVCLGTNMHVSTSGDSPIKTPNFDRLAAAKLTYRMSGDSFVLSDASPSASSLSFFGAIFRKNPEQIKGNVQHEAKPQT